MPALSKPIIAAAVIVPLAMIPAALSFANRDPGAATKASAFDRVNAQRAARGDAKVAAAAQATKEQTAPVGRVRAQTVIPGQYIVSFKEPARTVPSRRAGVTRTITTRKGKVQADLPRMGAMIAKIDAATADTVRKDPAVAAVEPNTVMYAMGRQDNPPSWGLDRIDQRDLPLDRAYTAAPSGQGVTAYVIDTGLNAAHTEFTGRVVPGHTEINDGKGTEDCTGHGTHVAGTIAGTTYGVAKHATIVPVRVLGCDGRGDTGGIIKAMDWVIAHAKKPAVVNMSLGGGASPAMDEAIGRLTAAGLTVAVAAGNEGTNACHVSPARAPEALTVGNATNQDRRAPTSNWGGCVDILAPGTNITSAWLGGPTATGTVSGTSMASPHVAGVAALFLEKNPSATVQQVTSAILNGATQGKLGELQGSPNALLYSGITGEGGPAPTTTSAPVPAPTDAKPGNPENPVVSTTHTTTTTTTTITKTVPPGGSPGCTHPTSGVLTQGRGRVVGGFTLTSTATVRGCLTVSSGVVPRLVLQRDNGAFWQTVSSRDEVRSSNSMLEQQLPAGRYRWVAVSLRGTGRYTFMHRS